MNFVFKHILHLLERDSKLTAALSLPWKQQELLLQQSNHKHGNFIVKIQWRLQGKGIWLHLCFA